MHTPQLILGWVASAWACLAAVIGILSLKAGRPRAAFANFTSSAAMILVAITQIILAKGL